MDEGSAIVLASNNPALRRYILDRNQAPQMRAELSASERAQQTARRKAIYLELHPETEHGVNQHSSSRQVGDSSATRFTADTAAKVGQSERKVQRDAERGEKVIDGAHQIIRGTALDTGTYLDKLKKLSPSEQVVAAKRDLAWQKQQQGNHEGDARKRPSRLPR
jgi:hypothetical protein